MLIITCICVFSYKDFQKFFVRHHIILSCSHFLLRYHVTLLYYLTDVNGRAVGSGNFAKVHDCGQRILKGMSHNLRQ